MAVRAKKVSTKPKTVLDEEPAPRARPAVVDLEPDEEFDEDPTVDEDDDFDEELEATPLAPAPRAPKSDAISKKNRYVAINVVRIGLDEVHRTGETFRLENKELAAELLKMKAIRAA